MKCTAVWLTLLAHATLASAQSLSLPGKWNWGAVGGIVEIDAQGSGRDPGSHTLQWTLRDAAARVYVIRWSHGYTDTVTLAADGNTLSAVNNRGMRFTATRVTGGSIIPPGAPLDLNGSWSGGLHIWQDGAQILATATWKRADGKYVIWRGEGRLNGRIVDLAIRYSPMTHGPVPEWRGVFKVSSDGNRIDAVYTLGATKDERTYARDR